MTPEKEILILLLSHDIFPVAVGHSVGLRQFLSLPWTCFLAKYLIYFADGSMQHRPYRHVFDDSVHTDFNNTERPTTATCSVSDNKTHCLNGGSCMRLSDVSNELICRCTSGWSGDKCQLKSIDESLWEMFQSSSLRSNIFAGLCAGLLLLFVGCLALIVFVRYRKKQTLSVDHLLKATAEELYRRPFNGRSSVVESLSRISSLRRPVANEDKDQELDGTELSVKDEFDQSDDTKIIKQEAIDASDVDKILETIGPDFTAEQSQAV